MDTYRRRFRVKAPLAAVVDFHRRSANMGAITPPPMIARLYRSPGELREGDEIDFTLWLPPFPIRWLLRIENVSPQGFDDRQLAGPFQHWVHRHRFRAIDENTTEVVDEIDSELKPSGFWRYVGLGMRLSLPILFAYRTWKTRRLLERD